MKKEVPTRAQGRQELADAKSLQISLEARGYGVLVLHCEGKVIQQGEARMILLELKRWTAPGLASWLSHRCGRRRRDSI